MSPSQQLTIEQALSKAKKAAKQGNTAIAVKLYNAILQKQPNHSIAKKGLRKLQEAQNKSPEAGISDPPQDQITVLVNLYNSGQMTETEQACRELLQAYPQSPVATNILGVSLIGQGRLQEAVASFDKAIQIKPDFIDAYYNRGNALKQLGQLDEAMQDFDKATQLKPDFAEAYSNRGVILEQLGKLDEAIKDYDKAIQLKPGYTEAYYNRGIALKRQGQQDKAIQDFDQAIQLKPDFAEAYHNLGVTLRQLGQLEDALENCEKAVQFKPDFAEAYFNRGIILEQLGQLDESLKSYDRAIQLKPDYAEAYSNRGVALKLLGQLNEAMKSFNKTIQLKPDFAEAYNNRGNALKDLRQLVEALKDFDAAIQLKPDFAEAYNNQGVALKDLGRLDEAMASFNKAIQLEPDYEDPYSNLLFALNYLPDLNLSDHIATARKFGELVTAKAGPRFPDYHCQPTPEKLRVGLVSGDLRNHPIGYFLESVLSSIDPSTVELIAYPTAPTVDDLSERIKPFFSMWKPIYGQTDDAAANMIYADGVHVLLDLSGHTAGNRLLMFGHKPSPVQVSWLGYFATTGLNEMDYLIGDPYVTPPKDDEQFTEKIWRLPETRWCFTPPDIDMEVSVPPAVEHGYITFGCFNNTTKINDNVVALWAKVLDAVPNSRLLLKARQLRDQMTRENIIQRFAVHGIDNKRISLEESEDRQKYFAAYNRIDITLDPFPFTGGTTSVESLWMGVPFVSLTGASLVSKQGVGVLMNAGLSDWVAADEEEYIAKAVLFAADVDSLARLRAGLRSQVLASPLFDAPRFARNIEQALWDMWKQWAPSSAPKEVRELPREQEERIDHSQSQEQLGAASRRLRHPLRVVRPRLANVGRGHDQRGHQEWNPPIFALIRSAGDSRPQIPAAVLAPP